MRQPLMVFAVLVLTAVACERATPASPSPPSLPSPPARPKSDPCVEIDGASFQSVKDLNVGLGPDGPVMGKWGVAFHGRIITLDSTDTRQTGYFTCSNGIISAQFDGGGGIQGRYDPTTRRLTLGTIEYNRVD